MVGIPLGEEVALQLQFRFEQHGGLESSNHLLPGMLETSNQILARAETDSCNLTKTMFLSR